MTHDTTNCGKLINEYYWYLHSILLGVASWKLCSLCFMPPPDTYHACIHTCTCIYSTLGCSFGQVTSTNFITTGKHSNLLT